MGDQQNEFSQLSDAIAKLRADVDRLTGGAARPPQEAGETIGASAEGIDQLLEWHKQDTQQEFFKVNIEIQELKKRAKQIVTSGAGGSGGIPGNIVLVKLSSNATGGGWYNGNIWEPPATAPSGGSTLSEAQVGTSGDAVLVCNLSEVTKNTHDIRFSGSPTPYQHIFPAIEIVCTDNTVFYALYGAQWGC